MTIFELNFLFFYINCVNYASYRTDFMNESPDISRTKKAPGNCRRLYLHIFWISAGLDDEPFAQLFLCQFPDGLLLLGSGIALGQGKGLALADVEQEGFSVHRLPAPVSR